MQKSNDADKNSNLYCDTLFCRIVLTCKKYRHAILACIVFGLLSYMFAFSNKLGNFDELSAIFGKGVTLSSGRWGLHILSYFIPDYSLPWLHGCATLFCITVSICLIIHIFSIKSPVLQIVLSGTIITCPSLIGTFAYMFTSSSYGVAFLMAILALYYATQRKWYYSLAVIACTVFSVSIYQSYIMVLASLMILFLIQKIMYSEESVKSIFLNGIYFLTLLVISLTVYAVITVVLREIFNRPLGSYAASAMGVHESLFHRIITTYKMLYLTVVKGQNGLVFPGISKIGHILAIVYILITSSLWTIRCKNIQRIILNCVLIFVMPIAIFGMYLAATPQAVHTLVLYSFIGIYVWAAIIIQGSISQCDRALLPSKFRQYIASIITVCMLAIAGYNVFIANEAYLLMYLTFHNMYSFSTAMIAEANAQPGYTSDTPIAIIGDYQPPRFYDKFSNINTLRGICILPPGANMTYYYCGVSVPMIEEDSEIIEELENLPDVKSMPIYPSHGSIKMINEVLVVKIADIE